MANPSYQIWLAGDEYLLADYSQVNSIELGIKAVLLKNLIQDENVTGVVDMIPSNTSLLIGYDNAVTDANKLKAEVLALMDEIEGRDNIVIPSRIIEFPVLFDDPWSKESVEAYCKNVKPILNNIEKIIRDNNLSGLKQLIEYYTTPLFIVTYVGFWPGLASFVCMDPHYFLSVEKYNPPRTSTPSGAIGIGGSNTSIYPMDTPGGFQLFGNIPTPIYHPEQKLPDFKETSVLCRTTDRFRFRSIDANEHARIKAECDAGTYRYSIENAMFDLGEYKEFIKSIEVR